MIILHVFIIIWLGLAGINNEKEPDLASVFIDLPWIDEIGQRDVLPFLEFDPGKALRQGPIPMGGGGGTRRQTSGCYQSAGCITNFKNCTIILNY